MKREHVIDNSNASSIYEVPLLLHKENLDALVCERLGLKTDEPDMSEWEKIVYNLKNPQQDVHITVVGKYTEQQDAYISITESFIHAGIAHRAKVHLHWVSAEDLTEKNVKEKIGQTSGILVRAALAAAASRGKSPRSSTRVKTKSPSLAFALACRWQSWSTRANVLGLKGAHTQRSGRGFAL